MTNPNDIPVLDIEVFKGISYGLEFGLERLDVDGNSLGPYNLTGKVVAVVFRGIFSPELVLLSGSVNSPNGSFVVITSAVAGTFRFHLTAAELLTLKKVDGDWRGEIRENLDAELIVRGSVRVVPFGGEGI